jgi:ribosome-binding ATPase YchF (GTP1/OBG family)
MSSCKKAAGKIHSDMKEVYQSEIVAYRDLKEAGSMAKARGGAFRLEGKEYPVQDGILLISALMYKRK